MIQTVASPVLIPFPSIASQLLRLVIWTDRVHISRRYTHQNIEISGFTMDFVNLSRRQPCVRVGKAKLYRPHQEAGLFHIDDEGFRSNVLAPISSRFSVSGTLGPHQSWQQRQYHTERPLFLRNRAIVATSAAIPYSRVAGIFRNTGIRSVLGILLRKPIRARWHYLYINAMLQVFCFPQPSTRRLGK